MLQATLKFFFSAAFAGCTSRTAHSRQLRSTAARRKCNHIETLLPRKMGHTPSDLPGFCPAVYPTAQRRDGLPLSDQHPYVRDVRVGTLDALLCTLRCKAYAALHEGHCCD